MVFTDMYRVSLIQIYSWMDDQQQIPGRDLRGYETVHKCKIKKNMVREGVHVKKNSSVFTNKSYRGIDTSAAREQLEI